MRSVEHLILSHAQRRLPRDPVTRELSFRGGPPEPSSGLSTLPAPGKTRVQRCDFDNTGGPSGTRNPDICLVRAQGSKARRCGNANRLRSVADVRHDCQKSRQVLGDRLPEHIEVDITGLDLAHGNRRSVATGLLRSRRQVGQHGVLGLTEVDAERLGVPGGQAFEQVLDARVRPPDAQASIYARRHSPHRPGRSTAVTSSLPANRRRVARTYAYPKGPCASRNASATSLDRPTSRAQAWR